VLPSVSGTASHAEKTQYRVSTSARPLWATVHFLHSEQAELTNHCATQRQTGFTLKMGVISWTTKARHVMQLHRSSMRSRSCQQVAAQQKGTTRQHLPQGCEEEDRVDCTGACLDSSRQGIYIPSAPDACSGVRSSAHLDPPTSGEGKPPETTSPQSCPAATLRERGGPYRRQGRQFFCTTTTQWVGLETGTF